MMKWRWMILCVCTIALAAAGVNTLSADRDTRGVDDPQWRNYHQLQADLQQAAARFPGAAGIVIEDIATGNEVRINADTLYPSASLVKVPIMAAYYQAAADGKLSLEDSIVLKRSHKVKSCSHLYAARSGRAFPIRRLIELMITESDNTATNMLVDHLGFAYLNEKFVEFGLRSTDLRRGVMDLKWRNRGIENYTTAQDMGTLLKRIYNGALVSPEASGEMLEVLKRQKVNDRIPRFLPANIKVAHKTGLLYNTVSDVGIVFTPQGDFIICVITADFQGLNSAKRFIGRVAAAAYKRCYSPPVIVS